MYSVSPSKQVADASKRLSIMPSNFNITEVKEHRNSKQHVNCWLFMLAQIMLPNHNPLPDA